MAAEDGAAPAPSAAAVFGLPARVKVLRRTLDKVRAERTEYEKQEEAMGEKAALAEALAREAEAAQQQLEAVKQRVAGESKRLKEKLEPRLLTRSSAAFGPDTDALQRILGGLKHRKRVLSTLVGRLSDPLAAMKEEEGRTAMVLEKRTLEKDLVRQQRDLRALNRQVEAARQQAEAAEGEKEATSEIEEARLQDYIMRLKELEATAQAVSRRPLAPRRALLPARARRRCGLRPPEWEVAGAASVAAKDAGFHRPTDRRAAGEREARAPGGRAGGGVAVLVRRPVRVRADARAEGRRWRLGGEATRPPHARGQRA